MRILLLTQWYPPEPQKILSDLSETLQAFGHEVTVLTGFPNYPSGKLYPGYRLRLRLHETMNGVNVIRVPLYPDHSASAVKRSLNFLSFMASVSLIGPWLVSKPDVVYVFCPPLTLACPGWLISRLFRAPLACEIQDMWPETLQATGMMNRPSILRLIALMGRWFYRRNAVIRVISPGFRDNLLSKGVPAEKIRCIPNWVDTDFYRPQEYDRELAEKLQLAGRFNVMYAGAIGRAQGLEVAIDAAKSLQDLPDVQFVLVGDGTDLSSLQDAARATGLSNVKFLGRYPESFMGRLFSIADVLLVHLRDEPLFRITIPHKAYTYMAVGKPVLAAVAGDTASAIASADAGLVCPPGNPDLLAATVRKLHAMGPAERKRMGENGRRAAIRSFSRDTVVRQIEGMLESITV